MSSRARTYFEISLVTIVLIFVTAIGVGVTVDIFFGSDPKAPEAFRGAFLGAFFAFLSVRIAETIKRFDDRRKVASRALVALELRYNQCAIAISTYRHLLSAWEVVAKAASTPNSSPVLGRFHPTATSPPDELLLDLTNVDLINELFNLNRKIDAISHSVEAFAKNHDKLADSFVDKKIDRDTFDINVRKDNRDRLEIELHIDKTVDEIERAVAGIVVLEGNLSLLDKLFKAVTPLKYPKTFEAQREIQLKRYRDRIAPMRKAREAELEEIEARAAGKPKLSPEESK